MKMLVDGKWVGSEDTIPVEDPYSGEVVDTVPRGTRDDVERAVTSALEGFEANRGLPSRERSRILRRTAELLEERLEDFAVLCRADACIHDDLLQPGRLQRVLVPTLAHQPRQHFLIVHCA